MLLHILGFANELLGDPIGEIADAQERVEARKRSQARYEMESHPAYKEAERKEKLRKLAESVVLYQGFVDSYNKNKASYEGWLSEKNITEANRALYQKNLAEVNDGLVRVSKRLSELEKDLEKEKKIQSLLA